MIDEEGATAALIGRCPDKQNAVAQEADGGKSAVTPFDVSGQAADWRRSLGRPRTLTRHRIR